MTWPRALLGLLESPTMLKVIVKLAIVAVGATIFALFKFQAKRKAVKQEQAGGCVACGSQRINVGPEQIDCLDCGYTGSADRGGHLAAHEVDAMYDHSQPNKRGW